ncbi:uncharacterized protein LOC123419608 [Hordeum vulgare subsp. vulgare]|uniref:Predicted protein n=1 Tax=Hordeum vulgare subsp. vulgare TaxID=112509 RepID=F2DRM3_HORVV|nr:uncharacterized protein LOC123419608 [Hordeum vulgare subsp. vulgare]BAJ97744.1 predicted protein [Hordeum vulgare subsp. vulgare]
MAAPWMEDLVKWLSVYMFRIVPLLSLFVYLILAVFSDSRRRENKGLKRSWKKLLVWLAYQLTDWGPAYVISNLYLETSPREKMSIAFWVPFLLLHHARPDNISAYAMEDSKLWPRLFLLALLKSAGSFIIVYRCILAEHTASRFLCWASGIMLSLGILKYLESMLALWRSDMGRIRHSGLSGKQKLKLDGYGDHEKPSELEDEKALLVAHDLFEICKGAFCDYTVNMDRGVIIDMFWDDTWKNMCKVVEMELSLMYDILYTKAAVVHTWHGYTIRVASPPLTATALLLFFLQCKKGMKPIDQVVSYTLLCTTFVLDLRWLFKALASVWTHSYFKRMPHNWLKHTLWCQGGWKKLRYGGVSLLLSRVSLWLWTCACPKEPKSYRRWAGTLGQCNLLSQCTAGNRHNLYSIVRLAIPWEGHSSSRDFEWEDRSRGLEVPDNVKMLVFQNIWKKLFHDPAKLKTQQLRPTVSPPPPPPPPPDSPDVRCPVCGILLKYCTCVNPETFKPDGRCPGCEKIPDYCKCVPPRSQNPDEGCLAGVPDGPAGPPGCGKLPNHCICVHPGSLDPGRRCLDILYGPSGTPCPRERICNGLDDDPALCPQYPREWICNGVEDQAAPWQQYPWEQICIGVNNDPPRLPYPWQVHAGMRNAPFDVRPHHHPDEQAAEYSTDCWRYNRALPEPYEQVNLSRHVNTEASYEVVPPETKEEAVDIMKRTVPPDKNMEFPPELQEAILVWHIATDVFLLCSLTEESEDKKAIKQISDYMMFLIAKHPEMLPGLMLRSLHEKTLRALELIWKEAKHTSYTTKEKVVARWMLDNPNSAVWKGTQERGEDNPMSMSTVSDGTQLARMMLSPPPKKRGDEFTVIEVERLASWIPRLPELYNGVEDMLEFILDGWVRLLMFASMRCSRDSHAKRLSSGGELTTLVWIIAEHTEIDIVKKHLKSSPLRTLMDLPPQ